MSDQATQEKWFGLGLPNVLVLGLALVVIVVGYVLLDRGSVTAAPIVLVVGYVVLIPVALLLGYRGLGSGEDGDPTGGATPARGPDDAPGGPGRRSSAGLEREKTGRRTKDG